LGTLEVKDTLEQTKMSDLACHNAAGLNWIWAISGDSVFSVFVILSQALSELGYSSLGLKFG
jgi:hypothetical protein